jgi:predicted nucleotidyltransferase
MGYTKQINVNKDYTGWELNRFLELMKPITQF